MDEKRDPACPGEGDVETNPARHEEYGAPRRRYLRTWAGSSNITFLTFAILFLFILHSQRSYIEPLKSESIWDAERTSMAKHKVTLEAHIMSKCPDARDCLRDLIVPVMANISDEVDFTLSYIGKLTRNDDNVKCLHGEQECLGNIIELCAANLYPDAKIYLPFADCMGLRYSSIPQKELVKDCALEHGIDFDKLNDCASDEGFGMDLLRNSVARTANANVTKSCTVRVNDKIRCIRDGGEWKDCDRGSTPEDLIKDIEKAAAM